MASRASPVVFLLALFTVGARHGAAQQAVRSATPDLAETLAVRTVLSQLITTQAPSAVIATLGLRPEDEQLLRTELARYREIEMPLRERAERLARAYASSPREEDQRARLAVEVERATLRIETHTRIIERLSSDGRSKWLARIGAARKQVMASAPREGNPTERTPIARRAASLTVTGRLRQVTCGRPMVLDVETGTTRLRLNVDDPEAISVLGTSDGKATLQCGGQDVAIRVGYDPVDGAPDGSAGVVRVLDYREVAPK